MKRIYCDRCGKVINVVPTLVEQQTNYVGDEIDFVILRIPKIFGNPSESVDLCADCKLKLKRIITDFLEELKESGEQE